MASPETGRMGKRGTLVIPVALRRLFALDEGTLVIAEARPDGILIRPAVAVATETYTPERKAVFLLENAADAEDYAEAVKSVRRIGFDPNRIAHGRPPRKRRKRKARSR